MRITRRPPRRRVRPGHRPLADGHDRRHGPGADRPSAPAPTSPTPSPWPRSGWPSTPPSTNPRRPMRRCVTPTPPRRLSQRATSVTSPRRPRRTGTDLRRPGRRHRSRSRAHRRADPTDPAVRLLVPGARRTAPPRQPSRRRSTRRRPTLRRPTGPGSRQLVDTAEYIRDLLSGEPLEHRPRSRPGWTRGSPHATPSIAANPPSRRPPPSRCAREASTQTGDGPRHLRAGPWQRGRLARGAPAGRSSTACGSSPSTPSKRSARPPQRPTAPQKPSASSRPPTGSANETGYQWRYPGEQTDL